MSINAKGHYNESPQRPPAPWQSSPADVNLNWHHVIPFAMMRDVWQALVMHPDLGKCKVALISYMRLIGITTPRQYLKMMEEGQLPFDQQEELDRRLAWIPWNIVEGPAYRVDDPKTNTSLDEFTAGLTITEWKRHQRIRELFIAFKNFNPAVAARRMTPEEAGSVTEVMNNVERTLVAGNLIRFRPAMWKEAKAPQSLSTAMEGVRWWRKKSGISFYERI